MKHTDQQIDKIIQESLSKEEAQFYAQLGEQNLLEMSLGVFQGKNKLVYIITVILSFAIFALFLYLSIQAYHAESIRVMFMYSAGAFWCMISLLGIKLWHWMQMNTNRVLREMKRLELQIATLSTRER